jgi:hypothetical protein
LSQAQRSSLGTKLQAASIDNEPVKVAILQSALPSQENIGRYRRAAVIYSELLTR